MMPPIPLTKKSLSMVGFLNMWNFGRWGCTRMKPTPKSLVPTWFIEKTFLFCYQILCPLKIQPSWKVFGLPVIGGLIMCEVPFLPLLMLILKTLVLLHINM
jgi:hypothetical protein